MERLFFPVALGDGEQHLIAGYLYYAGKLKHQVLQVTVHGATYQHLYWDLPPIANQSYSYARHMARQGYAVLAIDQLGTGLSSQPDGDTVTLGATANALHQVLVSLRTTENPTRKAFNRIALVGHSNGSLTAIYATGTYHDCDALITTAWLHTPHPPGFDPTAVIAALTTPYLPARSFSAEFQEIFFHMPSTDPAAFHFDYNHSLARQARAQFLDLMGASQDTSLSRSTQVTVPVLVQGADFDTLQPAIYMANEADYYPASPSVTLQYLDDMGHNVNAHRNHLQSWQGIDRWLRAHLH